MALDKQGRDYLNYRPKYGYSAPLYTARPFKGDTDFPEYIPSKCIEGLTDVLPASILKEIDSLLENLTVIQKRLEQCLQNKKADGITFTQYKHNLEPPEPDYRLINQWEHFQRTSPYGSIQGEIYRYVTDMQNEFTEYRNMLDEQFYGEKSDISIEKKLDEDKLFVDNMIKKDISGTLAPEDIHQIGVMSQLNHYALERTINAEEYADGLAALCTYTLNDWADGGIEAVVTGLAEASLDNVRHFNHINRICFRRNVARAENDRLHAENMNSAAVKSGLNETMFGIANTTVKARQPMLEWALSLDSDDDNGPAAFLTEQIVSQIEFLDSEHSNIMESMFGHNKLDKMSKEDMLNTLRDKKSSRMLVNLTDAMILEREKGTFDLNRFIQKNRLLEPGNMCTG